MISNSLPRSGDSLLRYSGRLSIREATVYVSIRAIGYPTSLSFSITHRHPLVRHQTTVFQLRHLSKNSTQVSSPYETCE
jgi:hypothetical protein